MLSWTLACVGAILGVSSGAFVVARGWGFCVFGETPRRISLIAIAMIVMVRATATAIATYNMMELTNSGTMNKSKAMAFT